MLPLIDFNHISKPGKFGATQSISANALALTRTGSRDTQRISLKGGWHIPRVGKMGELVDVDLSIRGDAYHNSQSVSDPEDTDREFSGRVFPQASFMWRFPVARTGQHTTQILEPIASLVVSPNGGNPDAIANDDSADFEFDAVNLFTPNRFTGLDRVEGGSRVNYGIKWGVTGINGGNSSLFVGQSFRFRSDNLFAPGSGLEDHFSDIVSSANVSPGDYFDLIYRTRLSHENLSPNKNELQINAGPPSFRVTSNYTFIDAQRGSEFGKREEISGNISSRLNRLWRTKLGGIYNLDEDGQLRTLSFGMTYECECFTFAATLKRNLFQDRDLKPETTILFQQTFKTLGDIQL